MGLCTHGGFLAIRMISPDDSSRDTSREAAARSIFAYDRVRSDTHAIPYRDILALAIKDKWRTPKRTSRSSADKRLDTPIRRDHGSGLSAGRAHLANRDASGEEHSQMPRYSINCDDPFKR
jgi:hypothetical protein